MSSLVQSVHSTMWTRCYRGKCKRLRKANYIANTFCEREYGKETGKFLRWILWS